MGRRTHLRRGRGPSWATLLLACLLAVALAPSAHGAAKPPLAQRLGQALAAAGVSPARTAALALDVRTGEVVFSRNATVPLVPASTEKLAVAYGALSVLGPTFRFETELLGSGGLAGNVWTGDLFLRGAGDPTLEVADLDALARELRAWGVRRVRGAVVGDESWFDARRTGPGWRAHFYVNESPPLSALVVARGWYRGSTSHNPALAAASLLRQRLEAQGITVAKRSRVGRTPPAATLVARDESAPLAAIVRFMGRESDNFTAELLVKQLGAIELGAGTTAAGVKVLRRELAAAGVPLAGVRLADGSGLSSLDRMTAAAVVKLLLVGANDPRLRDAFLNSLAVAGVDGTLSRRLRSRPARSAVIAKTGTTRLSSALAGFVRDRYVFAILHNGSPVATWSARRAQDRFATLLAGSR